VAWFFISPQAARSTESGPAVTGPAESE
jgi:hypothetical protein